MNVKRTERGWAGHFCCSDRCLFRRNTLLEYNDLKIVISTVGLMKSLGGNKIEQVGLDRYYETMAFHADLNNTRYYDADVERQIYLEGKWSINEFEADDKANIMHENVVNEITLKLLSGYTF